MGLTISRSRAGYATIADNHAAAHDRMLEAGLGTRALDRGVAPEPPQILGTVPLDEVRSHGTKESDIQHYLLQAVDGNRIGNLLCGEGLQDGIDAYRTLMKQERGDEEGAVITAAEIIVDIQTNFAGSSSPDKQKLIAEIFHLVMSGITIKTGDVLDAVIEKIGEKKEAFLLRLKYFLNEPLSNEERLKVAETLFNKSHISVLMSVILPNHEQAQRLRDFQTEAPPLHLTIDTSESQRLKSTNEDSQQLLGILSALMVGSVAAILFYPPVTQGLRPFLEILGWFSTTIDKFLNITTIFATIANSFWNSALLNEARKIWTKHLIWPLMKILSGEWRNSEHWKNLGYALLLFIACYSFARVTNRLITTADYPGQPGLYALTKFLNILLMTAAANAGVEYLLKLRRNRKTENLIERLLASGEPVDLQRVFHIRMFQLRTAIWKHSTPGRIKLSWDPRQIQFFDSEPLRKAVELHRNHKRDYFAVGDLNRYTRDLNLSNAMSHLGVTPSYSWLHSTAFSLFLFSLCFYSIFGMSANAILPPEGSDTFEAWVNGFFAVIGFIGWSLNEFRFSMKFISTLWNPSLVKYVGGNIGFMVNMFSLLLFMVCLPSGPAPAKGWFLLLEPAFDAQPYWTALLGFLSSLIWLAFALAGASNAFPIFELVYEDIAQAMIGLSAFTLGNSRLQNMCVEFKNARKANEKNDEMLIKYVDALDAFIKDPEKAGPTSRPLLVASENANKNPWKVFSEENADTEKQKTALKSAQQFTQTLAPVIDSFFAPALT